MATGVAPFPSGELGLTVEGVFGQRRVDASKHHDFHFAATNRPAPKQRSVLPIRTMQHDIGVDAPRASATVGDGAPDLGCVAMAMKLTPDVKLRLRERAGPSPAPKEHESQQDDEEPNLPSRNLAARLRLSHAEAYRNPPSSRMLASASALVRSETLGSLSTCATNHRLHVPNAAVAPQSRRHVMSATCRCTTHRGARSRCHSSRAAA